MANMKQLLIGLGVVLISIIFAVAAASGTWLFWEAWKGEDREVFHSLVGAFAGAFFAFLFIRLGEWLRRIFDRKEKHYNTLVHMQHYFNECLNITGDNIFVVETFHKGFSDERLASQELAIFFNRFQSYPIDREIIHGLTNIDLVNEVFTQNVELHKLNDSMATLDRSYEQIAEAFISKKINRDTYVANVHFTRDRYDEIKQFLIQAKLDLIRLLGTVRALSQNAPFWVYVIQILARSRYTKSSRKKIEVEISKLNAEIEAIAAESQRKIDQVKRI